MRSRRASPGRLDQVLYPYYQRGVERGELSVSEALELIGCLWLKCNDNTKLVPKTAEELFGGEPALHPDYVHALLRELKRRGVHVALQTCGFFQWESFAAKLLPWLDLIYFDIKCIDEHLRRSPDHRVDS